MQRRGIVLPQVLNFFGYNLSAFGITQVSTNVKVEIPINIKQCNILFNICTVYGEKVVRDVLLYDFESLLGEVGGNLGMFLGYSFLCFYHLAAWGSDKWLRPPGRIIRFRFQ